jgi:heat shock protein 90kDa beta
MAKLLSEFAHMISSPELLLILNQDSQQKSASQVVHDYAKRLRTLEINPNSPLIEGLLKRVEQLPSEEEEHDLEAEDEIKEVISVLVDSALVRSGFEVASANE